MRSSLSYSEVTAAVNGFKHSSSPEHTRASEIFLHLQFVKHPFKHSHLVNSNREAGAGKLNSHVMVPTIPCQCLCVCAAEAQGRLCGCTLNVCQCDNCIKPFWLNYRTGSTSCTCRSQPFASGSYFLKSSMIVPTYVDM